MSRFDAIYVRKGVIGSRNNRLDGDVGLAEKQATTQERCRCCEVSLEDTRADFVRGRVWETSLGTALAAFAFLRD